MRLKRKQSSNSEGQEDPPKKKQKGIKVSKVEVSDNIVKFFAAKGLFKKQWIVVKEIPILEIEHIKKFGNELSVTWKGTAYTFLSKEKTDIFSKLVDQVNGIIEGGSTEPPVAEPVAPQISTEPPSTSTEPSVVPPASTEPPSTSTEPSVVPPASTEPPSTSTEPSVPAPTDVTQPAPEGSMPPDSSQRVKRRKKREKANMVS